MTMMRWGEEEDDDQYQKKQPKIYLIIWLHDYYHKKYQVINL